MSLVMKRILGDEKKRRVDVHVYLEKELNISIGRIFEK